MKSCVSIRCDWLLLQRETNWWLSGAIFWFQGEKAGLHYKSTLIQGTLTWRTTQDKTLPCFDLSAQRSKALCISLQRYGQTSHWRLMHSTLSKLWWTCKQDMRKQWNTVCVPNYGKKHLTDKCGCEMWRNWNATVHAICNTQRQETDCCNCFQKRQASKNGTENFNIIVCSYKILFDGVYSILKIFYASSKWVNSSYFSVTPVW